MDVTYSTDSILCTYRLTTPRGSDIDNRLQKRRQKNSLQEIHLLRPSSVNQASQWLEKAPNLGKMKEISTGGGSPFIVSCSITSVTLLLIPIDQQAFLACYFQSSAVISPACSGSTCCCFRPPLIMKRPATTSSQRNAT